MKNTNHYASAEMLIRKPVNEVFEAFVDPSITNKFWFTDSSGKLEEGKSVEWTWSMYNLTIPVRVETIIPNEMILIKWGTGDQESKVEWIFKSVNNSATYVWVKNFDFKGDSEALISQIRDSTGGFTLVLSGLKAFLEHNIELNLVRDKWPKEMW